ncbi:copper homeostasis periplasmic binding protein CopC [Pseudochelatococcus sp. B33]
MNISHLLAAGTLASFVVVSPAWPHAHLDRATPAERALELTPPEAVTLTFTEEIEANLSRITLTNAKGETVATGAPEHIDGNRKSLRVTLPQLAPGIYKVEWTVTSVDTHRTEGDYIFTVEP